MKITHWLLQALITAVSFLMVSSWNVNAVEDNAISLASPQEVGVTVYTHKQLEQMLAPIALYPDMLVSEILMAAAYPREVEDAARWLQYPENAALYGDQLTIVLKDKPWDPSVKALLNFPQIVRMMAKHLPWTEQLGDAFIGQQAEVMAEIQHLRHRALAEGTLYSNKSQTVTREGDIISIVPTSPDVLYLPNYNPSYVYGAWPYPDYPPRYFASDFVVEGPLIDFGIGIFIVRDLCFFHHIDFHRHRIVIDNRRFIFLNGGHPPIKPGTWAFDRARRDNFPRHAAALQPATAGSQVAVPPVDRSFRGLTTGKVTTSQGPSPEALSGRHGPNRSPGTQTTQFAPTRLTEGHQSGQVSRPFNSRGEFQRPSAPMFQPQTRGFDSRAGQSIRGQASRSQMEHSGMNRSFGGGGRSGGEVRSFSGGGGRSGGEGRSFSGGGGRSGGEGRSFGGGGGRGRR